MEKPATTPPFDIDLVYLWVNGNDPAWRARHDAALGVADRPRGTDDCAGRYADNSELRYSLRSIEAYAPWVRRIFIVTDRQVPEWLDTSNPKIRIVDHSEIIPADYLPCFNSNVIEHFIYRIPGLAEHFLYANDDTFLNAPVSAATFFAADGKPNFRLVRRRLRKLDIFVREKIRRKPLKVYSRSVHNAARLVERRFGQYIGDVSHHNIDAYCKSDWEAIFNMFADDLTPTFGNRLRNLTDVMRIIYCYGALALGRGHKIYTDRQTSFMLDIHKPHRYAQFAAAKPTFFCVNDSQYASEADRARARQFMESRFPEKSRFELRGECSKW